MPYIKYIDLEPHQRLINGGRELLGKVNYFTVKRDGENVNNWINDEDIHQISSRNQPVCEKDIENRMKSTLEYPKIMELLKDEKELWNRPHLSAYGELLKTVSPTRLEPKRKIIHWILFDIYDADTEKFDSYEKVYQLGYNYGIPVVECIDKFVPETMTELEERIKKAMIWCGRHRREGIVGKTYSGNQTYYKEKRNVPKLPKIDNPGAVRPEYPPMPEDKVLRALQHAYDECTADGHLWTNKAKAMPIVAKHIAIEAREHCFEPPKSFYSYYMTVSEDKLKVPKND